ncbi:MAG: M23 family metallopeptidase [Ferruginibacter sp.]|nr:M23 family metallopeptidase [Cytophagales bacterium]
MFRCFSWRRCIFIFVGLLLAIRSYGQTTDQKDRYLSISYRESETGTYDFYAQNRNFCPYQLLIEFPTLTAADASVDLPFYTVINAQTKEQFLFSISPLEIDFTFKYTYRFWMGDPEQVFAETQSDYVLPYRSGTSLKVTQGYNGPYSHKNTYALDFDLKESTTICAAREGVVVKVKEDSKQGGPNKAFAGDCNFITIYQRDGTLAEYVHLTFNGSIVTVGDTVRAGQVIGLGGNTGWSTSPHLHFCVKKPARMGYQTIPVKFVSRWSRRIALQADHSYRAYPPSKGRPENFAYSSYAYLRQLLGFGQTR